MRKDKIILFSSSFFYLSLPQYKAILPELRDFKRILLNVNEPSSHGVDNDFIKFNNVSEFFDIYIKTPRLKQFKFTGLKSGFKSYIEYKKILKKYLNKISPNAIISNSDMRISDRALISWCKKNKVPFIILQPTFLEGGLPERYGFIKLAKYIIINKILGIPIYRKSNIYGNESQKSYLFLWGKYFIKNPKRKRMIIAGNAAFDKLFNSFSIERSIKKKVLICTQPFLDLIFGENSQNKVNNIYLEAIKSKPDIEFYIKVHPREAIEDYEKIFSKSKFPNAKVVKNQDLYELFNLCDIQISVFSFTSVEAAAMGLPIIILMLHKDVKFPDHFREEIEIRVTKVEEIVNAINLALSEEYWMIFLKKREKYFKKMLSSTDGKSANRVAEIIRNILKEHSV